jgi:hypothetical protein
MLTYQGRLLQQADFPFIVGRGRESVNADMVSKIVKRPPALTNRLAVIPTIGAQQFPIVVFEDHAAWVSLYGTLKLNERLLIIAIPELAQIADRDLLHANVRT